MIPVVTTCCHTILFLSRKQALQSALRCTSHPLWTSSEQSSHSKYFHRNTRLLFLLAAGGIGAVSGHWLFFRKTLFAKEDSHQSLTDIPSRYGTRNPSLPTYSFEEVSKHDSKEKSIWVTFREGVYDITDFIDKHPGGTQILMASGASVDPFWDLYAVHKTKNVLDLLESYRIGNLDPEDRDTSSPAPDHWADQPRRHPLLTPRSEKPYNAEPPPSLLVENFITPNGLFFVRNHLPVPRIDEKTYRLKIEGLGMKEDISLSLNDLRTKFPRHSVTTTIQCAGNRRSEMNRVKQVRGLEWGKAAISTATWTGVRLIDLLKLSGVDTSHPHLKHVQFEGLDSDSVQGTAYGASVPVEKVLDSKTETLIAFEMNGQPLPRDHGFPVRVIIPGIVGARQVKWLGKIILSDEESSSHWQQKDYKGFSPSMDAASVRWSESPAIQDSPVQSAICVPEEGAEVKADSDGYITVKGYAWSGGGRAIIRVDVSSDSGKTWSVATLNPQPRSLYSAWAWTLWEARVAVSTSQKVELICKATDSSYSTQPESFEGIYNFRGVLSNAWSRVNVKVTSGK